MATVIKPTNDELVNWVKQRLESGEARAEVVRDKQGNIIAVSVFVPNEPPAKAGRDPRQTRPL